jgi:predicted alpha/beta-hydrolase family hydrolase
MSGKIVVHGLLATGRMGNYMVCFPSVVLDGTTADVASAVCFGKNVFPFAAGKRLSIEHLIMQFEFVITP